MQAELKYTESAVEINKEPGAATMLCRFDNSSDVLPGKLAQELLKISHIYSSPEPGFR